LNINLTR